MHRRIAPNNPRKRLQPEKVLAGRLRAPIVERRDCFSRNLAPLPTLDIFHVPNPDGGERARREQHPGNAFRRVVGIFGTLAVLEQQLGRDYHRASIAVTQRALIVSRGASDCCYLVQAIQRLANCTEHI